MDHQNQQVQFRGSISRAEWARAAWLQMRRTLVLVTLTVLLTFVVNLIYLFVDRPDGGQLFLRVLFFGFGLLAPVLGAGLGLHLALRRSHAAYTRLAELLADQEFVVDSTGISGATKFGRLELPWSVVCSLADRDDMFVLRFLSAVYLPIPKRFFASAGDVDKFREIVRARAKPL
jgi:hypothetical protein